MAALGAALDDKGADKPLTAGGVFLAWSPWIIMAVFLVISGFLRQAENEKGPIDLGVVKSAYPVQIPGLHKEVERAYQLQKLLPEGAEAVPGEPNVFVVKEKDKAGNLVYFDKESCAVAWANQGN